MRVPLQELVFALSQALDFVEQELLGISTGHGKRVAYVSARICRAMGLSDGDAFDTACCAVLHDNALTAYMVDATPEDLRVLERFPSHCTKGEETALAFPFVTDVSGIILHHHENWDGSGFHSLKGDEIPLRAAILRVADEMDLLLSMGDGRKGLEKEMIEHARERSGILYNPKVVDALCSIADEAMARDLARENIEEALGRAIPNLKVNLSTGQVLMLCGIFAAITDAKSPYTKWHSTRVADTVKRLCGLHGIFGEHRDKLVIAALLHDLGKLATPPEILEKPATLTEEEFAIIRGHAAITEHILKTITGFEDIAEWCAAHHEKLDGSGYPHGRNHNNLPFEPRLLACSDIYCALTEDRPYRAAMDHETAIGIMREMVAAGQLDSDIVTTIDGLGADRA